MKHDLQHELRQDAAIRELAGMVASLAARCGATDVVGIAQRVSQLMSDDEAESDPVVEAAPSVEVDAETLAK